jgi:hypothetical protein
MDAFATGVILGLIAGVGVMVALVIYALIYYRRKCPDCGGSLLSLFRIPTNTRQALWGGWTCQECGCEVDRRGRKVTS